MTPTHLSMSHEGKEILVNELVDAARCFATISDPSWADDRDGKRERLRKARAAVTAHVAAVEKERDDLKAGVKRLSDEEELINETGRDGMLSAVHISARLAEAEKERDRAEEEVNRLNNALSAAEAERDELRAALEPFALVAEHDIGEDESSRDLFVPMTSGNNYAPCLTVGDLRRARAALKGDE